MLCLISHLICGGGGSSLTATVHIVMSQYLELAHLGRLIAVAKLVADFICIHEDLRILLPTVNCRSDDLLFCELV